MEGVREVKCVSECVSVLARASSPQDGDTRMEVRRLQPEL